MSRQDHMALLGSEDPAPVTVLNPHGASPFLLIGDHAGIAIPRRLGSLGVSQYDLARHIACDIGVGGLGEALSLGLDAVFIRQHYSRLVIDCNRNPISSEAVPDISDGTGIPGNSGLTAHDRNLRIADIHEPYQIAIAAEITRRAQSGLPTILVSLHSFAPVLSGVGRPWHAGVLHGRGKAAFAKAVLNEFAREPRLIVGDNEPYRMDETDYTVPRHAFDAGLPYVELEIRQDLIADADGQRHWSDLVARALVDASRQQKLMAADGSAW